MDKYLESKILCKFFERLYENGVCVRCILRIFRIETVHSYRDKQDFVALIVKVGEQLGDTELLLRKYDFLNYCVKQSAFEGEAPAAQEIKMPQTMKDQIVSNPTTNFKAEPQDCRICVGILQRIDKQEFIDSVMDKIKADDYEFENFKITVKCSLGVYVRQTCVTQIASVEVRQWCADNNITPSTEEEGNLSYFQVLNVPIDIKATIKWIVSGLLQDALNKRSDANDDRFQISLHFENLQDDFLIFGLFSDEIKRIQEEDYEEKIQKKLKLNVYKDQIESKYGQKKQKQVESFIPSQGNLERVSKVPTRIIIDNILKGKYPPSCRFNTKIEVKSAHENIFIKGNYIKYQRFISQTPWFVNESKIYETSIQDIIALPAIKIFKPVDVKFHSGGREDIDVRMLGDGRPFVLELVDPHKGESTKQQEILEEIQRTINQGTQVNIRNVGFTDTTCFMDLKNSEINKIKAYCCVVQTVAPITKEQLESLGKIINLEVKQKTPIRVLHRRSLLERIKIIHNLQAVRINDQFFILYVLASAGTYIKEFIHGDLERTKPSLRDLLNTECDIFQLDVVKLYEKFDEGVLQDFQNLSQ